MIIDIEDDLFYKMLKIVKSRNIKVYEQLQRTFSDQNPTQPYG